MHSRKIFIIVALSSLVFAAAGLQEGETKEFSFTGEPQEFEVPEDGVYELRVWGAQGGDGYNTVGGDGGYAEGRILIEENSELTLYVGGSGQTPDGGWNGGGDGGIDTGSGQTGGGGGGASDIRLESGELEDRIIVAGGGAGGGRDGDTGEGGGLSGTASGDDGNTESDPGKPGTQTSGGEAGNDFYGSPPATDGRFGEGGDGSTGENAAGGGGGGAGWYGGGGGSAGADHGSGYSQGGGGGSSYIGELDNASTETGINSGHGKIEIELIEEGQIDFCDHRGPFNECIMNETRQLPAQQFNVSSVFESRSNAVFEAFNDEPAVLQLENTTTISGLWTGNIQIESESPRLEAGAEFKPEGERIVIGK